MSEYQTERYACPDCFSSDGLALNTNGSGYCHACPGEEAYKKAEYIAEKCHGQAPAVKVNTRPKYNVEKVLQCKDYRPFVDRGIKTDTAKFFNVPTTIDGLVVFHYGKHAAKIRFPGKDFTTTEGFKDAGLFGQDKFPKGRKTLLVCEGEFDAMAAFQMQGSKWPTVSIKTGTGGALKDCKAEFEWMDSFEKIIFCFDADEPGLKAAAQCAKLFGAKANVMKHVNGYKDACDYLAAQDGQAFANAFWQAEQFVPDGIVPGSHLKERVMGDIQMPFCSYPWDCLNLMCYGLRHGEIVTITSGTGMGKSTLVKQIIEEIFHTTTEKIGVLSLEESVEVAALGMMSLSAGKLLHLPTKDQMKTILKDPSRIIEKPGLADEITEEEKAKAFDAMLANDRFMFLDHKGHLSMESVMAQIRYLAKSQDCQVILLDHISILVGLASNKANEREAIDETMHNLRAIVEETGVMLLVISHLSKPGNQRALHEEGGRVRLSDMRGSAAIAQLSNIAIGLEGNRQADNEDERNITILRVLKNRFSGETGKSGCLRYDTQSGRLVEVKDIDMEEGL